VDVCPHKAITLSDGSLDLDPQLCDDCGLCIGACPQHVLSNAWQKDLEQVSSRECHISCDFANFNDYGINIPCVYSIHQDTLANFVAKGVKSIVLNSGNCDTCPRYQQKSNIDLINQLLAPHPEKQIEINQVDLSDAKQRSNNNQPNLSRRSFFSRFQVLDTDKKTLIELLGLDQQSDKLPFVPEIDTESCQACHACSQLCPHLAIEYEADKQYVLSANNCNDCGLCTDICHVDAITVHTNIIPKQTIIPLMVKKCRICQLQFHTTSTIDYGQEICPTCKIMPKRPDRIIME